MTGHSSQFPPSLPSAILAGRHSCRVSRGGNTGNEVKMEMRLLLALVFVLANLMVASSWEGRRGRHLDLEGLDDAGGGQRQSQGAKGERMKKILQNRREGKFLNLLQVVTFPNSPCNGTTTTSGSTQKSGICYTAQECSDRSGVNTGECASGFGVCCTFTLGCGATTSENCTYFDSPSSASAGACTLTVCPCNSNICQLRLDFQTFSITGPSTSTVTVGKTTNGDLATTGVSSTSRTQCLTDTFAVTNPGGNNPPTICGSNTGDHMYVDASEQCNDLTFVLGTAADGVAAITSRTWSIKISQYSCDYPNLAPAGCVQYYFGTTGTGTIQSYNYDGGIHLANQQQVVCVRQERQYCRICVYAAGLTDFVVSGSAASVGLLGDPFCCSHSTGNKGYDCLNIPGASKPTATKTSTDQSMLAPNYCGNNGLVTTVAGASTTICTQAVPFMFTFMSDNYETAMEAVLANDGLQLVYMQDSTNCG